MQFCTSRPFGWSCWILFDLAWSCLISFDLVRLLLGLAFCVLKFNGFAKLGSKGVAQMSTNSIQIYVKSILNAPGALSGGFGNRSRKRRYRLWEMGFVLVPLRRIWAPLWAHLAPNGGPRYQKRGRNRIKINAQIDVSIDAETCAKISSKM